MKPQDFINLEANNTGFKNISIMDLINTKFENLEIIHNKDINIINKNLADINTNIDELYKCQTEIEGGINNLKIRVNQIESSQLNSNNKYNFFMTNIISPIVASIITLIITLLLTNWLPLLFNLNNSNNSLNSSIQEKNNTHINIKGR